MDNECEGESAASTTRHDGLSDIKAPPSSMERDNMSEMHPAALNGAGLEWVIDARGCDAVALADLDALKRLFARFVQGMNLHPAAPTQWHEFPVTRGITGLLLLEESHLTVHTFPEHGTLCLNLFCCRPRPAGDFAAWLQEFRPEHVEVRRLERQLVPARVPVEVVP